MSLSLNNINIPEFNIFLGNQEFKALQEKVEIVKSSYAYNNLELASKGMDHSDKEWNELDKKNGFDFIGSAILAFGGTIVAQQGYLKAGLVCLIDLVHSFAVALFTTIVAGLCVGQVKELNDSAWKYLNHSYIALVGVAASFFGYAGMHELIAKPMIKDLGCEEEQKKFVMNNPNVLTDTFKGLGKAIAKAGEAMEAIKV